MKNRTWIEQVRIFYAFLTIYLFWFLSLRFNIYARINGYSLKSICMISFLDEEENVDRTSKILLYISQHISPMVDVVKFKYLWKDNSCYLLRIIVSFHF